MRALAYIPDVGGHATDTTPARGDQPPAGARPTQLRARLRRLRSDRDLVERPRLGQAVEVVLTPGGEGEPAPGHEVGHGARHPDRAGVGRPGEAPRHLDPGAGEGG